MAALFILADEKEQERQEKELSEVLEDSDGVKTCL